MRPLGRALRYMTKYWPSALGAFFSMLLVSVANLVSPQLIRRAIDEGILVGNLSTILVMAAGLLGVALVRGLFSFAQGYLSEKASQGAAYDMRNEIYGKLQTLSFSFHDQAQTGQLMTRVTSDVEMVRMFTGQGFLQLLGALFMFFGAAAVLILMNWRLALITLAILPLIFISFAIFIRRAQPLFANVQARLGALNTVLQENLAGVRVVKAFVREAYEAERYARANDELLEVNLQVVRVFSSAFPVIFFIASLGTVAVVWYGGNQVIRGELSLGELVAFNTYLGLLMFPTFMLGMVTALVARAAASAKRIFEIVDAENDVTDRPSAMPLPPVEGRVAFEDVSFRYVGAERNVLEHASFIAEPGQTVAIVGTTGAGKSTIINLIPRFYDVTGGRVTIDGHDVRDVTIGSLRSQIGIVLQDTLLFSGTIRENIAYGAPDASLDEIVKVAQLAHAHDFILEQPEGYNTKIGEGGVGLSGGQMQRIAIARALLLVPQILILDDSTSSVDAETEHQIQRSLASLIGSRTTFIIAQRISTVRNADLILALDNARIVARGTHEELLATSALYGEIVASQLYDDVPAFADAGKTGD
ncbi:MAG: ABC transporter ATP-binding protein/permease [Chloroflexi bacterium]|nr:ABC transporter ATP-binding protein/permease [Chloroflexota bacterium]MDA8189224.1 ABC transporter ATP-binding protein [Dehalococcoidales bacterium]